MFNRVTMVLTVLAVERNSPFRRRPSTSRGIDCERSPSETDPMTRVSSVIGWAMSAMRVLAASTRTAQSPTAAVTGTRALMFPCFPPASPSRSISRTELWFSSATALKVSAIFPPRPVRSSGIR